MRTKIFIVIALAASIGSSLQVSHAQPIPLSLEESIIGEYRLWRSQHYPKDKAGKVRLIVTSRTTASLKGIYGNVVLAHYRIHESGEGWNGEWFRVTGQIIYENRDKKPETFFDTGFYQPGCGGQHIVELVRASSFKLAKAPILAVDEQQTSIMCDPAHEEKIRRTHFYAVRDKIVKVLALETSTLRADQGKQQEQTRIIETIYYPNGCPDEDDCKYLTVWSFDSTKPKRSVDNYSWDPTKSKLIKD